MTITCHQYLTAGDFIFYILCNKCFEALTKCSTHLKVNNNNKIFRFLTVSAGCYLVHLYTHQYIHINVISHI